MTSSLLIRWSNLTFSHFRRRAQLRMEEEENHQFNTVGNWGEENRAGWQGDDSEEMEVFDVEEDELSIEVELTKEEQDALNEIEIDDDDDIEEYLKNTENSNTRDQTGSVESSLDFWMSVTGSPSCRKL